MPASTIRIATLSDLETVAELFDLYRQFYEQQPDRALAESFLRARMSNDESLILLAHDEHGQAQGFCQLYPTFCSVDAAPFYWLYDLFVHPDVRRTGVGRALLKAAEQQAKDRGMIRMELTTATTNLKAQALYESMGWELDKVFLTYKRFLVV